MDSSQQTPRKPRLRISLRLLLLLSTLATVVLATMGMRMMARPQGRRLLDPSNGSEVTPSNEYRGWEYVPWEGDWTDTFFTRLAELAATPIFTITVSSFLILLTIVIVVVRNVK